MATALASTDINPLCPVYAPFFGAMVSLAISKLTTAVTLSSQSYEPLPAPDLLHIRV